MSAPLGSFRKARFKNRLIDGPFALWTPAMKATHRHRRFVSLTRFPIVQKADEREEAAESSRQVKSFHRARPARAKLTGRDGAAHGSAT